VVERAKKASLYHEGPLDADGGLESATRVRFAAARRAHRGN
jgi:hypothetical protein